MQYDLSICLPAHRTQLWQRLYDSAIEAVGEDYTWEMVLVGPNEPPPELAEKSNFKFFKDFGTPARCGQIATLLAEGELMMWASDDGYFLKDSIKECIEMHEELPYKDIVIVKYAEGRDISGNCPDDSYWTAWTHPDLRLPGVPQTYQIHLLAMYKLNYFRELGGFDCRWEHLNMNTHDLAFRAQRDGSKFHFSPNLVLTCDWNPGEGDHVPVQMAYHANDAPLFREVYMQDQSERIKIDYQNWIKSDPVWKRRFGDKK